MPENNRDELIDKVINTITAAFFNRSSDGSLAGTGPEDFLRILDEVDNFSVNGSDLISSRRLERHGGFLKSIIESDDLLHKKGRTLHFQLKGARTFTPKGSSMKLSVDGPFFMEFCTASQGFSDDEAAKWFAKDIVSLKDHLDFNISELLAAGILPQTPILLGVHTPISAEVFGFRLCLRSLCAVFQSSKIRLFAIGPSIREITF